MNKQQLKPRSVRAGHHRKLSKFIKPMLAQVHASPFDREGWLFEIKWDGYRAIAEVDTTIKLYSRNGLSFLELYPTIAEELKKIERGTILDGEIVAFNEHNKPDFQKLQQFGYHPRLKIAYYIFDCLTYKGKSIMHLTLVERKKILQKIIPASKILKYSDHVMTDGIAFFKSAVGMDLEGIIAKNANSHYIPGKRSADWLKIKNHNTQEAIIIGYTAPRGSRNYFGALLLAILDKGVLRYIGHTGTGFTEKLLKDLHQKLQPLKRDTSPLKAKISVNSPVTWVEPKLVCNVKFTEITQEGILRHPVFQGLRIDKSSNEANTLDVKIERAKNKKSR